MTPITEGDLKDARSREWRWIDKTGLDETPDHEKIRIGKSSVLNQSEEIVQVLEVIN